MPVFFRTDLEAIRDKTDLVRIIPYFDDANDLIILHSKLHEEVLNNTTFCFALARFLVSDLNIWRHGLSKFNKRKFSFLDEEMRICNDLLQHKFKLHFLNVQPLRNILQHFGEYRYGDAEGPWAKHSDIIRLFPQDRLEVARGVRVSFQNILTQDLFVSTDRTGNLKEVYIGVEFPIRIFDILSDMCHYLSHRQRFTITLEPNLSWEDYRKRKAALQELFRDV